MQYDLFISYARKDNVHTVDGKPGYITSFIEGLKREHRRFGGENLKICTTVRTQCFIFFRR